MDKTRESSVLKFSLRKSVQDINFTGDFVQKNMKIARRGLED